MKSGHFHPLVSRRVIAIEDRENHAAIELEREKGFTPRAVEGDPTLVMLEKCLR